MSEPLSPAKQNLLLDIVDAQDRMLDGVSQIFSGLRQSSDPEVSDISAVAFKALRHNKLTIIAMTERLSATLH